MIALDRCHDLAVHHDPNTGVFVLEYASQGRVVPTGTPYANRYISVLTIADRMSSMSALATTSRHGCASSPEAISDDPRPRSRK
jgi:hypothetical protein